MVRKYKIITFYETNLRVELLLDKVSTTRDNTFSTLKTVVPSIDINYKTECHCAYIGKHKINKSNSKLSERFINRGRSNIINPSRRHEVNDINVTFTITL